MFQPWLKRRSWLKHRAGKIKNLNVWDQCSPVWHKSSSKLVSALLLDERLISWCLSSLSSCKTQFFSRNACELLGRRSPSWLRRKGAYALPTVAIKAIFFCSFLPKSSWPFSFKHLSFLFSRLSSTGMSSFLFLFCSKSASHFPLPQFLSISFV